MSAHVCEAAPVEKKFLTRGVVFLLVLVGLGAAAALYRFFFGLSAATNLGHHYPWGIWIAIDVASGVALAAGGFTTAALAHIFHRHRYEVLVRPALLTAMLGYTFVGVGLLVDLGRFYNIWHPIWPGMWQGNSVLFEVAMCVVIYLHVLYFEFMPIVCERFKGRVALPGRLARLNRPVDALLHLLDRGLGKVMFIFIILGVVLSCMHQSSLGALLLIAPEKMHPLWYTPVLPLFFLMSAIMVGYPMVVVESMIAAKSFGRRPEMEVLAPLSRIMAVFAGIYLSAKLGDALIRETYRYWFTEGWVSVLYWVELALVATPLVMLLEARVRRRPALLFASGLMLVVSVVMNRINVFLVAYQPPGAPTRYFPSLVEVLVTVGLVAAIMILYRAVVTIFPVLPREHPMAKVSPATE